MPKYYTPDTIGLLNLSCIFELRKRIKDDAQRHTLIGLAVKLGDDQARRELPQNLFTDFTQTTTKTYEAGYVAKLQGEILKELEQQTPEEITKKLSPAQERITSNNLRESDLSRLLKNFKGDYRSLGKRVETRFLNINPLPYEKYKQTKESRSLHNLLWREEEAIREAIKYEIKR